MRTRSPLPSDRAALIALLDQKSETISPNPFRPEEVACAIELLEAALAQAEGNTYEARIVVDESDHPVSYACFGATPMTEGTFDLYWLVTDARARGQGLGAKLVAAVEDDLRARGALTVRVETSSLEGQGGAVRFYERCGYGVSGRIADFYRPGDDLLTLTKRLR